MANEVRVCVRNIEPGAPNQINSAFFNELIKNNYCPGVTFPPFNLAKDIKNSAAQKALRYSFIVLMPDLSSAEKVRSSFDKEPLSRGSSVLMQAFIIPQKQEQNTKTPATASTATPAQSPVTGVQQTTAPTPAATGVQQKTATTPTTSAPPTTKFSPKSEKHLAQPVLHIEYGQMTKVPDKSKTYQLTITGSWLINSRPILPNEVPEELNETRVAVACSHTVTICFGDGTEMVIGPNQVEFAADKFGTFIFTVRTTHKEAMLHIVIAGQKTTVNLVRV